MERPATPKVALPKGVSRPAYMDPAAVEEYQGLIPLGAAALRKLERDARRDYRKSATRTHRSPGTRPARAIKHVRKAQSAAVQAGFYRRLAEGCEARGPKVRATVGHTFTAAEIRAAYKAAVDEVHPPDDDQENTPDD